MHLPTNRIHAQGVETGRAVQSSLGGIRMRGTSLPFLGLALFLTVVWVASPVIAQQLPPSVPGPRTIVAGESLAGIAIGGLVTAVSTSNSLMRAGEIGPGFSVDDAVKMFGAAYHRGTVEGFQGLQFNEQGIAFGIDRRAVAVILVFSPGQAAQVSGLQRSAKLVQATPLTPLPAPAAQAAPVPPLTLFVSGIPFVATQ